MAIHGTEAERLLSSRRKLLAGRRSVGAGHDGGVPVEAQQELGEIDAALARIADGTFGTCEVCGGAIGRDRLRALPEVTRCVTCAAEPRAALR